jgi:quercetin dioxygenase-like cupin family protein
MERTIRSLTLVGLLSVSLIPAAETQGQDGAHTIVLPSALTWADVPSLPPGAKIAIVAGDPGNEGLYVARFKFPAGYEIPAHTHPNDENVTVISGTFHIGMGDKLDETKGRAIKAGGFFHMPRGMRHYAWASEETIVQANSIGPAGIAYVNPADDPRPGKPTQ